MPSMKPTILLVLFILNGPVYSVTTQGMVGYWTFDGSARDTGGYAHHGVCYTSPVYVAGRVGLCLDLEDGKNHVVVDNSDRRLTITRAVTVEAWIKDNNFGNGYRHIFGKENSYTLSVYNGNAAVKSTHGWWIPHNTRLPTGQWIHVAWTCDGSRNRIYINGKETVSSRASGTFPKGGKIVIGHPAHPFTGLIDEVKVYKRALTAAEINSSYFEGAALVAYWPLDGGTKDHGDSGNHEGALVGLGLRFSKDNDHISINSKYPVNRGTRLSKEVTVTAWIMGDAYGSGNRFIYENPGSHSLAVVNGKPAMSCAGEWWGPDTPLLETGRWYHMSGTCDGQWKKLYIDGKEVARAVQTSPIPPAAVTRIGRGFHGLIDEVKVYNNALPAAVIEQNYNDIPRPVGIWSFDNNARDKSGYGHHGKPINGPRYTRGKTNQCLRFDGNNDYVLIDNGDHRLDLWGNLTIEAWVYPYTFKNDYQHIYDKYRGHTLSVKNGKLAAGGRSGWWFPTATALKTHRWWHVVGTDDHDERRLYINGVLMSSQHDEAMPTTGDAVYIGHPYIPFHGLIDEIKVYNKTLSARDVLVRYRAGHR